MTAGASRACKGELTGIGKGFLTAIKRQWELQMREME